MSEAPLTPAEIQSLTKGHGVVAPGEADPVGTASTFDPRALDGLRRLHVGFCQRLGAELSELLRSQVTIQLLRADVATWSEIARRLPSPTCLSTLSAEPWGQWLAIHISPAILFPLMDRLLGGRPQQPGTIPRRPLTAIEQRLAERLVAAAIGPWQSALRSLTPVSLTIERMETDPQRVPLASADAQFATVACEAALGDCRGPLELCLPVTALAPAVRRLAVVGDGHCPAAADGALVELTAQLAETTITAEELHELQPGDVITTTQPADGPALITVEGVPKFRGRAGHHQGRLAVRIEERISDGEPT